MHTIKDQCTFKLLEEYITLRKARFRNISSGRYQLDTINKRMNLIKKEVLNRVDKLDNIKIEIGDRK